MSSPSNRTPIIDLRADQSPTIDLTGGRFLDADVQGIEPNLAEITGVGSVSVDSFFGGPPLTVPELRLTTPRQNEVSLIDATSMHPMLGELHGRSTDKFPRPKLLDRILGTAVRIADIPGANGLHHLHGTDVIPGTVYYPVVRSTATPRPQIARIPSGAEGTTQLAYLTSVHKPADEKRLRRVL